VKSVCSFDLLDHESKRIGMGTLHDGTVTLAIYGPNERPVFYVTLKTLEEFVRQLARSRTKEE
jgi:hypothetical protein